MSSLIFVAIVYGIYCLYQTVNADSIEWRNYYYQSRRLDNVESAAKRGEAYIETPLEKKMHERYGYRYDPWYKDYLENKEIDRKTARGWIFDNLFWK